MNQIQTTDPFATLPTRFILDERDLRSISEQNIARQGIEAMMKCARKKGLTVTHWNDVENCQWVWEVSKP